MDVTSIATIVGVVIATMASLLRVAWRIGKIEQKVDDLCQLLYSESGRSITDINSKRIKGGDNKWR